MAPKKKQNVFADEEEQQPNSAYNKAVEAAKHAATPIPIAQAINSEASMGGSAIAPATVVQQAQEIPPPESPAASKPEKQTTSKPDRAGEDYTKVTYRVCNEAAAAIEDMKLLLKREYGFKKIRYEEIVEEALLGIKRDLDEQKEQSILVQRLREQKSSENQ